MYSKKSLKKIPDKTLEKIIKDLKRLRLLVNEKPQDDVCAAEDAHTISSNNDQMIIDDFLIGGCNEKIG